jgi:putative sigma-54 modulation protein
MIKCEVTARNFEVDDKIKDYVEDKIGGLDKYLPRKSRETALAQIVLCDDPNGREDNRYVCEAVVRVGGEKMVSAEGTINMFAAIDIVEAKLKVQFSKFKDKRTLEPRRARMLSRLVGRKSETDTETPEAI